MQNGTNKQKKLMKVQLLPFHLQKMFLHFFLLNSENNTRSVENPLSVESLKDHLWRKQTNKNK